MSIHPQLSSMLATAALALLALATPALAQAPATDKPLKAILPVGAGSSIDTIVRSIAPSLSKALGGQPVVIENLPGAAASRARRRSGRRRRTASRSASCRTTT